MQKSLNQTKKSFLCLSIFIGSLTFTTQAQNTGELKDLFLSCKDTSQSVDKSLHDVVINTVKATDLFADLAFSRWSLDALIRDRSCVIQQLNYMKDQYRRGTETIQVAELASELTYRGGVRAGALERNLKSENGFCTEFYYRPGAQPEQPNRSKCNELKDQLLKSKYSSEQTFKSKTFTQDFLGGITGIQKIEFYWNLFTYYKVYVVTHKSNPNSAYVFIVLILN